jgi:hypothetical protein
VKRKSVGPSKGLAGSGTQGARRFWIAFFLYDEKIPRLMQKRFDRTPNRKKGQRGFWQGGGKCKDSKKFIVGFHYRIENDAPVVRSGNVQHYNTLRGA